MAEQALCDPLAVFKGGRILNSDIIPDCDGDDDDGEQRPLFNGRIVVKHIGGIKVESSPTTTLS